MSRKPLYLTALFGLFLAACNQASMPTPNTALGAGAVSTRPTCTLAPQSMTATPTVSARGVAARWSDRAPGRMLAYVGPRSGLSAQGTAHFGALGLTASSAGDGWLRLSGDDAGLQASAAKLVGAGEALYVQPEYLYTPSGATPNDPLYLPAQQAQDRQGNLEAAWSALDGHAAPACGAVTIAVIDTGFIDENSDDLSANLAPRAAWLNLSTGVQGDATPLEGQEAAHGTAVASVIAMTANNGVGGAGAGHNLLKVLPINAYTQRGSELGFWSSNVATAIDYAVGSALLPDGTTLTNPAPASVINLSFGTNGADDAFLEQHLQRAEQAGVLIVAASGNAGHAQVDSPARSSSVIGVGAVDEQGARAGFSNYGAGLQVVAPGTNVLASAGGEELQWDGTSFATPYVAAQAGLWLYAHGGRVGGDVRSAFLNCARQAGNSQWQEGVGYGVLDTLKLLDGPGC